MATLLGVGDVMLGRRVSEVACAEGTLYPFEYVASELKKADVVIGNLESPLSTNGVPNPIKPADLLLRADPSMASRLRRAGFDVLSLANNHTFDYGKVAFDDTLRALEREGIRHVGAGSNGREARKPVILEVGGFVLGFLAYTYGYAARARKAGCAFRDPAAMKADILSLRTEADVIVVSLHDGIEFSDYPIPRTLTLAHQVIEWGADLVLGHHPHTLQGIEEYRNGLIAYSLGDFVFDNADEDIREAAYRRTALSLLKEPLHLDDLRPLESIMLECQISRGGIDSYRAIPVRIGEDFQPCPDVEGSRSAILKRLRRLSEPLQDPEHPIWHEMEWVEHEVRKLSLGNLPIGTVIKRIGKLRARHLRLGIPYLGAKFSRLVDTIRGRK